MVQWMMGDLVDGSVWATGWDSRRNTGPGIGLGLAQPPEPASDTEHASRHTHLHSHCLDTAADTGHLDRHMCIYTMYIVYIQYTIYRHTHSHCLDTADTGHLDRHSTCVKTTQTQQTQRGIHVYVAANVQSQLMYTLAS